ncbi:MAG: PilZ domain-containing protein [bacterium]|nr:hypothetical protein [Deltaproteobacteria bacterium]MCP4907592.1 PilZ domain-containing protein [bacterium]
MGLRFFRCACPEQATTHQWMPGGGPGLFPRHCDSLPAHLEIDGRKIETTIREISLGGACLLGGSFGDEGSEGGLSFEVADRRADLPTRTVWTAPDTDDAPGVCGASFREVDPDSGKTLDEPFRSTIARPSSTEGPTEPRCATRGHSLQIPNDTRCSPAPSRLTQKTRSSRAPPSSPARPAPRSRLSSLARRTRRVCPSSCPCCSSFSPFRPPRPHLTNSERDATLTKWARVDSFSRRRMASGKPRCSQRMSRSGSRA